MYHPHRLLLICMPLLLTACQPSAFYVPQTQEEALAALDKAGDYNRASVDRRAWADAAIRSNLLSREELADAYYYRAETNHDLGRYEQALDDMEQVVHLLPNDGQGYGGRGAALHALGYYDDAIGDYRHAYALTRDQTWLDYVRMAEEDRRLGRAPAGGRTGRQPAATQAKQHALIFDGFYAENIQRDSIVNPDNEVFLYLTIGRKDEVVKTFTLPSRGAYTGISKGRRVRVGKQVWVGRGDDLIISISAWEHDSGGPSVEQATAHLLSRRMKAGYVEKELSTLPKNLFGTYNDLLGHAQFTNVNPANNLAYEPNSKYGFTHHLSATLGRGGARYHFFFSFREQ